MNQTIECVTINFLPKPIIYVYYDHYELSTLFMLFITLAYIRSII